MSFVDIATRRMAQAELRRFVDHLGRSAVLDQDSRVYRDLGLAYLVMDDDAVVERGCADARVLRLPLVRDGARLSAGSAESEWQEWLSLR